MRISDWSSDVCSSDLALWAGPAGRAASDLLVRLGQHGDALGEVDPAELPALLVHMMDEVAVRPPAGGHPRLAIYGLIEARSEEHTSELQSLMRSSYAVLCLKKKNNIKKSTHITSRS